MSARAYRLMLACCLAAGIGLTALLVRWQGTADGLTTSARQHAAVVVDRNRLASGLNDARARIADLERQLAAAAADAAQQGSPCVNGWVWPRRSDGSCHAQDRSR